MTILDSKKKVRLLYNQSVALLWTEIPVVEDCIAVGLYSTNFVRPEPHSLLPEAENYLPSLLCYEALGARSRDLLVTVLSFASQFSLLGHLPTPFRDQSGLVLALKLARGHW